MLFLLLLIVPGVRVQENSPSNALLGNFRRHPFTAVQFLSPSPAKNGPVLFPNDAPPPPPTPLIVTSRPLSESIARSELNANNSLAAQSQLNQVSYQPNYLARVKTYSPYPYSIPTESTEYDFRSTPTSYIDSDEIHQEGDRDDFYAEYEKLLEKAIRRVKHDNEKEMPLDQSYYHRSMEQKHRSFATRGSFSYNDDDRSTISKEGHSSLHSRETNHRQYKSNHAGYRRLYKDENELERRTQYNIENSIENSNRDSHLQWRPARDIQNINVSNNEVKQPDTTEQSEEIKKVRQLALHAMEIRRKPITEIKQKNSDYSNNENGAHNPKEQHSDEYNKIKDYAFSYTVKDQKTGDDFSHSQQSKGRVAKGEYRVRLPDGRIQVVSYTADENGYKADVKYNEEENHGNSVDVEEPTEKNKHVNTQGREMQYHVQHSPFLYKTKAALNELYFDSKDFSGNKDYIEHRFKGETGPAYYDNLQTTYKTRPTVYAHDSTTDYHNDISHYNSDDQRDKSFISANNDNYLEHYKNSQNIESVDKLDGAHDREGLKSDGAPITQEIIDYSSEFNSNYEPYNRKFASFHVTSNKKPTAGVTPSYKHLKSLLETTIYGHLQNDNVNNVQIGSTLKPYYKDATEKVVVIGTKKPSVYYSTTTKPVSLIYQAFASQKPKFYTHVENLATATHSRDIHSTPRPTYASTPKLSHISSPIPTFRSSLRPPLATTARPTYATTPSSYLHTTITNLKNRINLNGTPQLSQLYIDKINKYLSYK